MATTHPDFVFHTTPWKGGRRKVSPISITGWKTEDPELFQNNSRWEVTKKWRGEREEEEIPISFESVHVWEQIGSKYLKRTFTPELAAYGKWREAAISGTQFVSPSRRCLKKIRWLTPWELLLLLTDDKGSPEWLVQTELPAGARSWTRYTPSAVSPNTW